MFAIWSHVFDYRGWSLTTTKSRFLCLVPRFPRAPQIISVRLWRVGYLVENPLLSFGSLLIGRYLAEEVLVSRVDWAPVRWIHTRYERRLIMEAVCSCPVQVLFVSPKFHFFWRSIFSAYQLQLNLPFNTSTTRLTTRLTTSMSPILLKIWATQTALILRSPNISDNAPS